jgi:hypothetical protein
MMGSSRGDDMDTVIRFTVVGFIIGEALGFLLTFFYMRKSAGRPSPDS